MAEVHSNSNLEMISQLKFNVVNSDGLPSYISGEDLIKVIIGCIEDKSPANQAYDYLNGVEQRIDQVSKVVPGSEEAFIDEVGGAGTVATKIEEPKDVVPEEDNRSAEVDEEHVKSDEQENETENGTVTPESNEEEVRLPVTEVPNAGESDLEVPDDIDSSWITEIDDMKNSNFKLAPLKEDFDPSSYVSVYNAGKYDEDQIKGGLFVDGKRSAEMEDEAKYADEPEEDNTDVFANDEGFVTSDDFITDDEFEGEVTSVAADVDESPDATVGEDFSDAELDPYLGANPSSIDNPFADFDEDGDDFGDDDEMDTGDIGDGLQDAYDFEDDDDDGMKSGEDDE